MKSENSGPGGRVPHTKTLTASRTSRKQPPNKTNGAAYLLWDSSVRSFIPFRVKGAFQPKSLPFISKPEPHLPSKNELIIHSSHRRQQCETKLLSDDQEMREDGVRVPKKGAPSFRGVCETVGFHQRREI